MVWFVGNNLTFLKTIKLCLRLFNFVQLMQLCTNFVLVFHHLFPSAVSCNTIVLGSGIDVTALGNRWEKSWQRIQFFYVYVLGIGSSMTTVKKDYVDI